MAGRPCRHQIVAPLIAPLIAFLLVFFGAGLRRRFAQGGDAGHGSVAFGGTLLGPAGFALVGMLERAMTNAAHEGQRTTVYTLNQLRSYDWLAWNAAFAAMLLATGLGARRNAISRLRSHGDDRHRRIAPDAARVLRIHPRSGVADRGWALAQPKAQPPLLNRSHADDCERDRLPGQACARAEPHP